jgi:DNA modification methylase
MKSEPVIVNRNVEDLIPYAKNSRTHSDAQVAQIAASVREFGWTNPVLIDGENGIIAGHGRVLAARKLGMVDLPCIELAGLTDTQRRAYIIADNKLGLNAGWDDELLAIEFAELADAGFDTLLTGFTQDEIDALTPEQITEGLTDEDAVPELQAEPISKLGDVWLLGKHRVMCGDSTSIDAVETLMDGAMVDMVFTDPPYGMSYGGGRARGAHQSPPGGRSIKSHGMIIGDDKTGDDLIALVRDALASAVAVSKSGSATYVCFPWRTYSEFESAMEECGLKASACIVWDKKSIGLGNANYRPQHEFIFYCKGGAWYGDKAQSDVWSLSRGATGKYVHPTQKPVELIEQALNNSSKGGDTVLDVFGGSGSTLIACEKTGREARLMELDPKYVDVIVRRWQEFTGKQATHAATGATFAEVEADSTLAIAEEA